MQTSVRARNSWAPVLGGPKAFLAFAARNLPDSHSEDPRKISSGSGRSRRIILVTYAQSLPCNKQRSLIHRKRFARVFPSLG